MRYRLAAIVFGVAVLVPLGVSVMVEAAPWQQEDAPRATDGGPTEYPRYDVIMTPNPDCLGGSPENCIDFTNTEFCPKFRACEAIIELAGWEELAPAERAQFRADYLAEMRSIPGCPPGYDSNKPEFQGKGCIQRRNPEAGPPAPDYFSSEALPVPTDQGRLADPNCPPIYGWPVPEGAYCPVGGSERAEEEWKQAGSPMKGAD